MPRRKAGKGKMHGEGWSDFTNAVKSGFNWIKKNKGVSKLAGALADEGIGGDAMRKVGNVAGRIGLGKKRGPKKARKTVIKL